MSNNRKYIEYTLVATDQAMRKSGDIQTTGGTVDLSSNQLGLINVTHGAHIGIGTYLTSTNNVAGNGANTASSIPAVKFVQGTSKSAGGTVRGWHYEVPRFVETCEIKGSDVVRFAAALPEVGSFSAVFVDTFATPTVGTEYAIHTMFNSTRKKKIYGSNQQVLTVRHTAADATDKKDYLIKNLLYKLNLHSVYNTATPNYITLGTRHQVVGLAIDIDGGGTGTAIGALAVGDSVNIFKIGSTTVSMVITKPMLQALYNLITNTNITTTSEIQLIDLSTAGTGSGTGTSDALVIMGLEHELAAAYDDVQAVKVDITQTQFGGGFAADTTFAKVIGSYPVEDTTGRNFRIRYDERSFAQTGSNELAGNTDELLRRASGITETSLYTAYYIDAKNYDRTESDEVEVLYRITVLVPATDDSGSATAATGITATTNASTLLSDLEAIVKPWLSSVSGIQLGGDATSSTYFG